MDRRDFLRTTAQGLVIASIPSQTLTAAMASTIPDPAAESKEIPSSELFRFIYPQRPLGISWPVSTDDVTALYGSWVGGLQATVQYQDPDAKPAGAYWLAWNGAGAASWNISAPEAGDYELNLCYASSIPGVAFTVSVGDNHLRTQSVETKGYWPDDPSAPMNFERIALPGRLRLAKGENILRLDIAEFRGCIRVRSLELVHVSAKAALRADADRARDSRANTDWFVKAGYGLFSHWTSQVPPLRGGKPKPYEQAVNEFDVDLYANMVAETGSQYVIFTANHAEPTFPGPLKTWEHYHPGWTTQRDLISELADALNKRGVHFVMYLASEICGGVRASRGVRRLKSTPEYQKTLEDILMEIGTRYGKKVPAYWFDHASWSKENFPHLSFGHLWTAVKSGNPDRLVAYNFWQFPIMTQWQDYYANEGAVSKPPASRYMEVGPAKGLQYHVAVPIDGAYIYLKPDSDLPGPIYKDDQLVDFVKGCIAKQGVVTLGTAITQDLHMNDAILKQFQAVRKAIRGS